MLCVIDHYSLYYIPQDPNQCGIKMVHSTETQTRLVPVTERVHADRSAQTIITSDPSAAFDTVSPKALPSILMVHGFSGPT